MKKHIFVSAIFAATAISMSAQDNLLANKPIYTLGEALTWSSGDNTYTFVTEDLAKLVAEPSNTDNVYLYPENGALNTEENQAKGAQPFYIDMEKIREVKQVMTTWEGAAADAYNIYLTDTEPTLSILKTTPTYSATGLGQYTANTATLPAGSKGRYLVFQTTNATNWGWGVKIRSISAAAPADDVLTTFTVTPPFCAGTTTNITWKALNQFGQEMPGVEISVAGGTLNGSELTINGESAMLTAKAGNVELNQTVYAVSTPTSPEASQILTPIYTNTSAEYNGTSGFIVAYNGGATELGRLTWPNGEVAAAFGNTRCVFFYNNDPSIMGGWNVDINPDERGFGKLHLDIFATTNASGTIEFERTTVIGDKHPIELIGGQWNSIDIELVGETSLYTMSVRFDEANACDIILSNIYFGASAMEGDETAPELGAISVTPGANAAVLSLSATDQSGKVYFNVAVEGNAYAFNAKSGETVECVIPNLKANTEYTATIIATDGKNATEPQTVKFTTTGYPAAPLSTISAEYVYSIYSNQYNKIDGVRFDNWGSPAYSEIATDENGKEILTFLNYGDNHWGGLVDFGINAKELQLVNLHVDIYGGGDGQLTLYPVWTDEAGIAATAEGTHTRVNVKANQWNHYDFNLENDFGYTSGTIFQFAMTESSIPSFALDNLYFDTDGVSTSVNNVAVNENATVTVYNLQGRIIRANVEKADATAGLPAGLYMVGTHKVLVK